MKAEYIIGTIILLLAGVGLIFLFVFSPVPVLDQQVIQFTDNPYKEIVNPSGFVNTEGITLKELIGKKVILLDFLTYSCINCQRTFPYINAWYDKYKGEGLEIIGIHTPEFAFEKDINNVEKAMKQFGITHPIVLDNDYATWRAYGNRYWPRKYIIDIHGNIVYDHIGEGGYKETEMKIKELLTERASVLGITTESIDEKLAVTDIPEGKNTAQSPETYLGSLRNERLANGFQGLVGEREFILPKAPILNALYLGGTWNINPEYAESISNAHIVYRYNAKEVYLVMESHTPITVEVWQDGVLVNEILVEESKLYTLIQNKLSEEHTLELRVKGKGLRTYAFTFG